MAPSESAVELLMYSLLWVPSMSQNAKFFKVEVEVLRLINPEGRLATGKTCDRGGSCDPTLSVFLDTVRPLMAWPGDKAPVDYDPFFKASDTNSPAIHKNVLKNICGGSINKVNLRVHVLDGNVFLKDRLIEDFECVFDADENAIGISEDVTEWSAEQDCRPVHTGSRARLQYRFRLYSTSLKDCDIQPRTFIKNTAVS